MRPIPHANIMIYNNNFFLGVGFRIFLGANELSFNKLLIISALTLIGTFGAFPGFDNSAKACPSGRPSGDLIVRLRQDAVPFTDFNEAGRPTGFNVALWKEVAETLRVPDGNGGFREPDVTFVECNKINEQETALIAGHVDVVISPLTITSGRMQNYNFSQQYILSGLSGADLRGARIYGANLKRTNLPGTDLYGADISSVLKSQTIFCDAQMPKGKT